MPVWMKLYEELSVKAPDHCSDYVREALKTDDSHAISLILTRAQKGPFDVVLNILQEALSSGKKNIAVYCYHWCSKLLASDNPLWIKIQRCTTHALDLLSNSVCYGIPLEAINCAPAVASCHPHDSLLVHVIVSGSCAYELSQRSFKLQFGCQSALVYKQQKVEGVSFQCKTASDARQLTSYLRALHYDAFIDNAKETTPLMSIIWVPNVHLKNIISKDMTSCELSRLLMPVGFVYSGRAMDDRSFVGLSFRNAGRLVDTQSFGSATYGCSSLGSGMSMFTVDSKSITHSSSALHQVKTKHEKRSPLSHLVQLCLMALREERIEAKENDSTAILYALYMALILDLSEPASALIRLATNLENSSSVANSGDVPLGSPGRHLILENGKLFFVSELDLPQHADPMTTTCMTIDPFLEIGCVSKSHVDPERDATTGHSLAVASPLYNVADRTDPAKVFDGPAQLQSHFDKILKWKQSEWEREEASLLTRIAALEQQLQLQEQIRTNSVTVSTFTKCCDDIGALYEAEIVMNIALTVTEQLQPSVDVVVEAAFLLNQIAATKEQLSRTGCRVTVENSNSDVCIHHHNPVSIIPTTFNVSNTVTETTTATGMVGLLPTGLTANADVGTTSNSSAQDVLAPSVLKTNQSSAQWTWSLEEIPPSTDPSTKFVQSFMTTSRIDKQCSCTLIHMDRGAPVKQDKIWFRAEQRLQKIKPGLLHQDVDHRKDLHTATAVIQLDVDFDAFQALLATVNTCRRITEAYRVDLTRVLGVTGNLPR